MQRQCQFESNTIFAQLFDPLGHPRGRYGDAAWAHGHAIGSRDSVNRPKHLLIIQQRFTHAHEHNIGELASVFLFTLGIDQNHFVVDLVELQISFAVDVARSTEFAIERTANLGGYAGGQAQFSRDQYTLYEMAVPGTESEFAGAVF